MNCRKVGIAIFSGCFIVLMIYMFYTVPRISIFAQEKDDPKTPTGYFVEVASLTVPEDITTVPVGAFILYDKSGNKVIWRENVTLGTYTTDEELELVLDAWADPYIDLYEKQVTLDNLAKTSSIVGQKLLHKK